VTIGTLPSLLEGARTGGYAVPAFNVVDLATMDGVLRAAQSARSPVVIQTAAKTARTWGPSVVAAMFRALATSLSIPAVLQLDHTSELPLVDACLAAGWNAVLFDGSALPADENVDKTRGVVRRAHDQGAAVEGELVSIRGHEEGVASFVEGSHSGAMSADLAFIEATGIDCFAPSIGNVHGRTVAPPTIDVERARSLAAATRIPLALHGGTGIPTDVVCALIAAGCTKVNVSTALREAATEAIRAGLPSAGDDPLPLLVAMRDAASAVASSTFELLGSAGRC
jgi:fructose-bisphosphate aldolase class II